MYLQSYDDADWDYDPMEYFDDGDFHLCHVQFIYSSNLMIATLFIPEHTSIQKYNYGENK